MSIQTTNLHQISELPLSQISRPIQPVLDYQKIDAMVSTYKGTPVASRTCSLEDAETFKDGNLPPIDVMSVREQGQTYYFAFGGCHRFQAYDRLAKESQSNDIMVRCKIMPATRKQLRLYVGDSIDSMFDNAKQAVHQAAV